MPACPTGRLAGTPPGGVCSPGTRPPVSASWETPRGATLIRMGKWDAGTVASVDPPAVLSARWTRADQCGYLSGSHAVIVEVGDCRGVADAGGGVAAPH